MLFNGINPKVLLLECQGHKL